MTFDPNSASQIPVDPDLSTPASRDSLQQRVYRRLRAQGVPEAEAMAIAGRVTVRAQADQVKAERRASGESAREEAEVRTRIDDDVRGYPMPQRPAGEKEAEDEYIRRFKVPPDARQLADFQRQLAQEQQQQLESDLDASGYGRERVPGARGLDGRPAKRGTPFESVEDAEAYNTRTPDASGQSPEPRYTPSQRDLDMHARGYAPVFNEDGSVGYSIATPDETLPEFASGNTLPQRAPVRGAPGRWGDRPDLKGYDPQVVEGPLGPVQVYRPRRSKLGSVENPGTGDGAGDRIDRYRNRRMRSRLRAASGLEPKDAAKITDLDELRELGDDKRLRDKAARQDLVTQRAQMQQNPLLYLSNPNVDPWSKMVMADQLLRRGFTGPTPLGVEAARNAQLTELGLRVAQGQGFQQMTPEQRRASDMAAAQAEGSLPVETQADMERKRNGGRLPANSAAGQAVLKQIEAEVIGSVYATQGEVDDAVARAVAQGIPQAEAEAHFAPRRRSLWQWATGASSMPPAGATPPSGV